MRLCSDQVRATYYTGWHSVQNLLSGHESRTITRINILDIIHPVDEIDSFDEKFKLGGMLLGFGQTRAYFCLALFTQGVSVNDVIHVEVYGVGLWVTYTVVAR